MPVKSVKRDKKSYPSIDHVMKLTATRSQVEGEKLRSLMNKKLSGVFAFTAEMNQRMIELSQQAQAAIDAGDPSAKITLSDGSAKGADTVRKAIAGAMSGDLKTFEGWKKFANTYFRDLKEGQQLGHENIAVATATAAMYLKGMAHDDPLRPALRAYYLALKEVDKMTAEILDPKATMMELINALEGIEGINISQALQRDIDIVSGSAKQSVKYSYEDAKINRLKGTVGGLLMGQINALFDIDAEDIITKNNINVLHHSGSQTFMEDIKDGMIKRAMNTKARPTSKIKSKKKQKTKIKTDADKQKAKLNRAIAEFKRSTKANNSVTQRSSKATGKGSGQLASLIQLLNAKLPQTVAENMGPPGLEYRTGRFASSVRVTDVNQTAQGYPSIGYTYQRNPYQVFEMGAGDQRWATPERDPRKLIDRSIREIASQLAIGRFYTRRI